MIRTSLQRLYLFTKLVKIKMAVDISLNMHLRMRMAAGGCQGC
ncbi:MAG TPA: hypothetical protein VK907_04825 [Phnomibacter sp.]|nr:hypothetical protein [Phnomibacter sp.]